MVFLCDLKPECLVIILINLHSCTVVVVLVVIVMKRRRKLRVLILSMGGERQEILQRIFDEKLLRRQQQQQQQQGKKPCNDCNDDDDDGLEFEPPTFCAGIPSRDLRNRQRFFQHCHRAGLLPEAEWEALQTAFSNNTNSTNDPSASTSSSNHDPATAVSFWECLQNVPVVPRRQTTTVPDEANDASLYPDDHDTHTADNNPNERQKQHQRQIQKEKYQNKYEKEEHYCVELWRKAKTVNRGRAVLACALAHLVALKLLVTEHYDVLLEDNVRSMVSPEAVADRMWDCILAYNTTNNNNNPDEDKGSGTTTCHMRYFGWLGSIPNLQWIYNSYIPSLDDTDGTTAPCPTTQDIEKDLLRQQLQSLLLIPDAKKPTNDQNLNSDEDMCHNNNTTTRDTHTKIADKGKKGPKSKDFTQPGGNPVWGTYAYWISPAAYETVLETLRNDVGALLWKSKRMRFYHVKPIDKIVPRIIRSSFGGAAVHIAKRPAFFRAPMLTSQIHSKWDPEFCKSTSYQLQQSGLKWLDLSLTDMEKRIVAHATASSSNVQLPGDEVHWLTPTQWHALHDDSNEGIGNKASVETK